MGEIVDLGKLKVLGLLAVLALIISGVFFWKQNVSDGNNNLVRAMQNSSVAAREKAVLEMLGRNFVSRQGLLVDKIEEDKLPSYVLLESMGQLMEYAVIIGNEELFASSWRNTVKCMQSPEGYFYWRAGSKDLSPDDTTALVDEMRVITSLAGAAKAFQNPAYDRAAGVLARSVYKYNVKGDRLHDAFDGGSKSRDGRISLFYIDPRALREMVRLEPGLGAAGRNALKILMDAPVDEHGFFPAWYDYRAGEYKYPPRVNMVEALYTARNAREAGRDISSFTNFLKSELTNRKLYNNYNRDGSPAGDDQSTAVYALACRLLQDENATESAKTSYRRMTEFQVAEWGDLYCGGFGDFDSGTFYAFDQMEALMALHTGGRFEIEDRD